MSGYMKEALKFTQNGKVWVGIITSTEQNLTKIFGRGQGTSIEGSALSMLLFSLQKASG